jgi:hypothetical protein
MMPKYRDPRTGETVELLSDANEEFYFAHGWELIDGYTDNPVIVYDDAIKASKKSKKSKSAEGVEAE